MLFRSKCHKVVVNTQPVPAKDEEKKESMTNPDEEGEELDYHKYIMDNNIESCVRDSHKQFIDETHHRTTGASKCVENSHVDFINPGVGLRFIPQYREAVSGATSRTVSSEDPETMARPNHYMI